jgi:phosphomannomutase
MATRLASISGVRGIVGDGFDPSVAVDFVAAYASTRPPGPVVVGHDGRATAHVFEAAVISALLASGHDVLTAGAVATPTVGALVRDLAAVGAVQVSASHNPREYNGLKLFDPAGTVLRPDEATVVLARFESGRPNWVGSRETGRVTRIMRPDEAHQARVLNVVDPIAIRKRRFRVLLDSCHGAGGRLGASLLRDQLGCELWHLGDLPDGQYDHDPEPLEENLAATSAMVRAIEADIGFVQDPDADRLAIIDGTGRFIGEELTLALAAMRRLDQIRGPLVLNLSTSRTSQELAEARGCKVVRAPVGEIHVVDAMRGCDAVFGGEGNGGVIDPRVGFVRDSFVGMALVLDLMTATGKSVADLTAGLPRFSMIKRKFPRGDRPAEALFDTLLDRLPHTEADRRDGLRLDGPEGWIHLRPSNTEPVVRLIVEARTPEQAKALADRVEHLFSGS